MTGAFGIPAQGYMPGPGYGPMMPGMYPPAYGYPGMYAQANYGMYPQSAYPPPYGPMRGPAYLPAPAAPAGAPSLPTQAAGPPPVQRRVTDGDDPYQHDPTLTPAQLLVKLRESLYPSQREWAANRLANVDWRRNAEVAPALMLAAREDPSATVRAGCIRALARMKVNTPAVVEAMRSLKSDSDPHVQREAEEALATLTPGDKPFSEGVQPTSATAPARRPSGN
jgi:hypothetical protein